LLMGPGRVRFRLRRIRGFSGAKGSDKRRGKDDRGHRKEDHGAQRQGRKAPLWGLLKGGETGGRPGPDAAAPAGGRGCVQRRGGRGGAWRSSGGPGGPSGRRVGGNGPGWLMGPAGLGPGRGGAALPGGRGIVAAAFRAEIVCVVIIPLTAAGAGNAAHGAFLLFLCQYTKKIRERQWAQRSQGETPAHRRSSRAALLCKRGFAGSKARAFRASSRAWGSRPVRCRAMERRSWGRLPHGAASQM